MHGALLSSPVLHDIDENLALSWALHMELQIIRHLDAPSLHSIITEQTSHDNQPDAGQSTRRSFQGLSSTRWRPTDDTPI
jgi:hypothetical protein